MVLSKISVVASTKGNGVMTNKKDLVKKYGIMVRRLTRENSLMVRKMGEEGSYGMMAHITRATSLKGCSTATAPTTSRNQKKLLKDSS
jgi:hypothetical protein